MGSLEPVALVSALVHISPCETKRPKPDAIPASNSNLQPTLDQPPQHQDDPKPCPRTRWRPRLHVMPPSGWLNDPCGPGFDPVNGVYHLGFQWNPNDAEWGNACWGAAWSRDLVSWEVCDAPSLSPAAPYDHSGIFTGCMVPTGADGTVTCVYTSVSRLPIHYTLPYVQGSETLSLASSTDGGRVWVRHPANPILPGPPPGVDVTGWRDPYVAPWPALDALLREEQQQKATAPEGPNTAASLYGLLSGGIRGVTPAVFLYQVDSNALGRWRYLGALTGPGCLNHNPSPRWTGDFGRNWEVCNFFSLAVPGGVGAAAASREFLLCGVEGRLADPTEVAAKGEFRATHAQMWMCGRLGAALGGGSGVELEYRYGGVLDHGAFYAGNSFWDPLTRQQVVFGWVLEEDLSLELRRAQGWAGVLTLPRVLRVAVLRSVVGALVSPLRSIGCVELIPEDSAESRFTVVTLCAVPDTRLRKLRGVRMCLPEESDSRGADGCYSLDFPQPHAQWEMRLLFAVGPDAGRVGFDIIHSPSEKTTVYFDPASEAIIADRSKSSFIPGIRRFTESAPHTLFTFAEPNDSTTGRDSAPQTRQEVLEFHVFYDTSVLEIFANERTTLTTRVYPTSGTSSQIRPFIDTRERTPVGGNGSRLVDVEIWPLFL